MQKEITDGNAHLEADQVFDTFLKFSDLVQKKDRQNKLIAQNRDLASKCGSCQLWMTKRCPREARHKVHTNELKCDLFKIDLFTESIINKNLAEIELLSTTTTV